MVENPRVSVSLIESPEVAIIAIASSTRCSHFHCITEGIHLIIGQSWKREEGSRLSVKLSEARQKEIHRLSRAVMTV